MKLTPRKAALVCVAMALTLAFSTSTSAFASPDLASQLADKRAQATQVSSQIDALNTKVELAAEAYNKAGDKLAKINDQIDANTAKLERLAARQAVLDTHLSTRVTDMYRGGRLGILDVVFGSTSFEEFAANWDLMNQMNENDASLVSEVKSLKVEAQAVRVQLHKNQAAAEVQLKARRREKAVIVADLAQRKTVLASVNSQIKTIMAEQAAAAAAAARARAAELAASGGGGSAALASFPLPTIPAHGTVVDYAKSRLGAPYVWAAAGPDTFDCSGLAMWCYAQIGISLPHYSGDQINVGQRVSQADLQPGDLVFFGSPIHHVGIYVGGGQMIDAPYTGSVVRYDNAFRGDFAGASRP